MYFHRFHLRSVDSCDNGCSKPTHIAAVQANTPSKLEQTQRTPFGYFTVYSNSWKVETCSSFSLLHQAIWHLRMTVCVHNYPIKNSKDTSQKRNTYIACRLRNGQCVLVVMAACIQQKYRSLGTALLRSVTLTTPRDCGIVWYRYILPKCVLVDQTTAVALWNVIQ